MFSLIITVISIALVAVLALATLYYGGTAFGKGAARAEASKVVLQGQQLLGAADLFYTANRRWPANIDELVNGNYLKQVPNAGATGLSEAIAAGQPWQMVANSPTFFIPTGAADVCAEVNLAASLRKRGILRQAYTGLVAQCYGEVSSLTTVFRKNTTDPFQPGADVSTDPLPPTDPTDPDWTVPPGEEPPTTGGGGGGGSTPYPAIEATYCAPTFPTIAQGSTGQWGMGAAFQIKGDEVSRFNTWPALPSASYSGGALPVNNTGGFGPDTVAVYVDTTGMPPGAHTVTLQATNGQTVSCALTVTATDLSDGNDAWEMTLSPPVGTFEGGTLVTLTVPNGSGVFKMNDGQKPGVMVYLEDLNWGGVSQFYQLPPAEVTFVDASNLRVRMPPAAYAGASQDQPQVYVRVTNFGSTNYVDSQNTFAYDFTAPPTGGGLTFNPNPVAFGDVAIGESASQQVTVRNTTSSPVTFSPETCSECSGGFSGLNGDGYAFNGGTCASGSLPANGTCTFTVTFNANTSGPSSRTMTLEYGSRQASLEITANVPCPTCPPSGSPHLYGNATDFGVSLMANPHPDFTGPNAWETHSALFPRTFPDRVVRIYNDGSLPGGIAEVRMSSGTSYHWTVLEDECTGNAIEPNDVQNCVIVVQFTPDRYTDPGLNEGTLEVVGSNGQVAEVPLTVIHEWHDIFYAGTMGPTTASYPTPMPDFVHAYYRNGGPGCPGVSVPFGSAQYAQQVNAANQCLMQYQLDNWARDCQYFPMVNRPEMNHSPGQWTSVIECYRREPHEHMNWPWSAVVQ